MAEPDTNVTETTEAVETTENTELAKLRAEFAKQKAALDKATKEAGDYRKALRAKQTEEEVAAEEKRLADEARDKKLAEYERRFVVAETSKKIMGFVGDEATANAVAEHLFGADDIDAALTALQRHGRQRKKRFDWNTGKSPHPA